MMQIFPDRPSRIYAAGEKAVFHFSGVRGETEVVFSLDGEAVLERTTLREDAILYCGLEYPGVLRCTARDPEGNTVLAGAAFDPEKIRPALPEPEDFQAFWEHWKQVISEIPEEFRMEPAGSEPGADFYNLTCTGLRGKTVYAYLRLPKTSKKVPLFVYVEGAGRGQNPETFRQHCSHAVSWLGSDVACLTVSVHDWKAPETDAEHKKEYEDRQKKRGRIYWLDGIEKEDPSEGFFLRAITGAMRMCNLVSALPEIDPDRIACLGLSQGGAFGMYLTALCPQIRACFSGVPAFGDVGGFLLGRHTPQSCIPEFRNDYEKLRYYDIANFAKRIRVPVFMSAGLIDSTCTPSSVYAVYNTLTCRKMFFCKPEHGHNDGPADYTPLMWSFLKAHLL